VRAAARHMPTVALREKVGELSRTKAQQEEELNAQIRVGEQLRRDLEALTKTYGEVKTRADEVTEQLAARDRQLERAQERRRRVVGQFLEHRLRGRGIVALRAEKPIPVES